jgi:hypothetical protein
MTLITIRKGTESQWQASNRILQSGEPGYDTSNRLFKIGDGISNWSGLPYYGSGIFSEINHYHNISNISNFGSGVSGLLPVKNISASTGIFVSEVDGVFSISVTGNFGLIGSQVDSRVSGYLQAGSGVYFNYINNSLVINSSGTGSSNIDIEDVENTVDSYFDTFLVAGTGINFSYHNNELTIKSNLVMPPVSSTGSGIVGQFSYDSDYFYVCVALNLWKRTSLNSW